MPTLWNLQFLAVALIWHSVYAGPEPEYVQPEQVHISLGKTPSEMWVTWVTLQPTGESVVEYGTGVLDRRSIGTETTFVDGGSLHRHLYIHRVLLTSLRDRTTYSYYCGSELGWSPVFTFKTLESGVDWAPRFAVYGDMGSANAQALPYLIRDAHKDTYDVMLHVGDFAYDMHEDNATVGDKFFNQIQSIAAHVPYMTAPGNHENAYNFSNYRNRFTMPGSVYYSMDIGPVHLVAYSSEVYFGTEIEVANQYAFLERDFALANANRANVPWIVAMGHRPLYCSNLDRDDCTKFESKLRVGLEDGLSGRKYGLEDIFFNAGVDLVLQAHEHSYERMLPLYNRTIFTSPKGPYIEPCTPVQLISGAAGNRERTDTFQPHPPPWAAFKSTDYGYGRMTVLNATHLYYEQVSADQRGKVIDKLWVVQHSHGPFDLNRCDTQTHRRVIDVDTLPRELVNITRFYDSGYSTGIH